ncbi:MAG: hypothetical protein MI741_19400 [Rhodospirillales bacterium]|nr:hypothetical protein [Rhodospirillales bacterium]
MRITAYKILRLSPPDDTFIFIGLETDGGIAGWGEITGSGHDLATVTVARDVLHRNLGHDPLDIDARMSAFRRFQVPPLRDRCAITAWCGVNQALWDIAARAREIPLYGLLGNGARTAVPLYANLNRGLLKDRSPAAFARNAEDALSAGFAFAKATPFDEVTPACTDALSLNLPTKRLDAVYSAIGTEKVAVDCHWRFNMDLARRFMELQALAGPVHWIEDLLDSSLPAESISKFRRDFPGTCWAGGEDATCPREAGRMLDGPARPDVFMPDIKHLCGLDDLRDLLLLARSLGCSLSLHNPSGPISTAFSAHMCVAVGADEPLEFCFRAVKNREVLTDPFEPVTQGVYTVSDGPGIGIIPARSALEQFGTVLAEGSL